MRAVMSEQLRNYLHQQGKTVGCACETTFRVTVEAEAPRDSSLFESFLQDGLRIYYSLRLDHTAYAMLFSAQRACQFSLP